MTLMHYLCKVLASKSPTLLDFHEDFVNLEAATKIKLKVLSKEIESIQKGLEKVKQELAASANDGPESKVFPKTLKEFVRQAEEEVTSVTDLYSVAVKNADAIALYFGEDPARCPFQQATLTLLNFVRLFRKCHEENIKRAEREKRKAEKDVEMENENEFNLTKNGGQSSEPPVKHFSQTMEPGTCTPPPNKESKSNFELANDYFVPHLRAAILTMDDELIDSDQVEYCLNFCIMKEETEQLKNFRGDYDKLSIHEQYVLELTKVPCIEEKLRVFLFKIQFNHQISKFKRSLNTVNSACDEVRESIKLKEIMNIILYLRNTLNQETDKDAEVGFKLEYLLKLTDTQASNSKMTLLHYLCKVLDSKSPSLLDLHEDLISLEAATKIELKDLAEEWPAIIQGMEQAKHELVASANEGPISEVFHKSEKADALTIYFGEDPNYCPFEQVTLTLLNFVRIFRKCNEEIRKEEAEMNEKINRLVVELENFTLSSGQRMELEKEYL